MRALVDLRVVVDFRATTFFFGATAFLRVGAFVVEVALVLVERLEATFFATLFEVAFLVARFAGAAFFTGALRAGFEAFFATVFFFAVAIFFDPCLYRFT